LVKYYVKRYGEVPPNNNNFPDKYIDWESLRDSDTNRPIPFSGLVYPPAQKTTGFAHG